MRQCNCCGRTLEYGFGVHDGQDMYCDTDCLMSITEDVLIEEYIDYMLTHYE